MSKDFIVRDAVNWGYEMTKGKIDTAISRLRSAITEAQAANQRELARKLVTIKDELNDIIIEMPEWFLLVDDDA